MLFNELLSWTRIEGQLGREEIVESSLYFSFLCVQKVFS